MTRFYNVYASATAPVGHLCRVAAKNLGKRGISVDNFGAGQVDTYDALRGMLNGNPIFYLAEFDNSVTYHSVREGSRS